MSTNASTYSELMAQAEALMRQAEEVRRQEIAGAINEIKEKIRQYQITPEDLGFKLGGKPGKALKAASGKQIRYRGPNGETWTGGPGRKPQWVKDVLSQGGDIESYRIAGN